jgi:hypothetical protein
MGSCSKQAGDGGNGVPFDPHEQGMSAATDAGIGIGAGHLTQLLEPRAAPVIWQHPPCVTADLPRSITFVNLLRCRQS